MKTADLVRTLEHAERPDVDLDRLIAARVKKAVAAHPICEGYIGLLDANNEWIPIKAYSRSIDHALSLAEDLPVDFTWIIEPNVARVSVFDDSEQSGPTAFTGENHNITACAVSAAFLKAIEYVTEERALEDQ